MKNLEARYELISILRELISHRIINNKQPKREVLTFIDVGQYFRGLVIN